MIHPSKVADRMFVEDLLLYLKSQHKIMDENQTRLERLEKQTSRSEEATSECRTVLPKSAHITSIHSDLKSDPHSNRHGQFRAHAALSSSSCSSTSTTNHHTCSFVSRLGSACEHAPEIAQVKATNSSKACNDRCDDQRESIVNDEQTDYRLGTNSAISTKNNISYD